jgi:hypothetical protein
MSDMNNNAYFDYEAQATDMAGIYTGAMGPGTLTLVIGDDGDGVSCYWFAGILHRNRIKLYATGDMGATGIVSDNGQLATIQSRGANLTYKSYNNDYMLQPDPNLDRASIQCQEVLSEK